MCIIVNAMLGYRQHLEVGNDVTDCERIITDNLMQHDFFLFYVDLTSDMSETIVIAPAYRPTSATQALLY